MTFNHIEMQCTTALAHRLLDIGLLFRRSYAIYDKKGEKQPFNQTFINIRPDEMANQTTTKTHEPNAFWQRVNEDGEDKKKLTKKRTFNETVKIKFFSIIARHTVCLFLCTISSLSPSPNVYSQSA